MISQLLVHSYYVSKELVASVFKGWEAQEKKQRCLEESLCIVLKNDPELILRKPHGLSLGEGKEHNKREVSVYGLGLQRAYIHASQTS